MEKEGDPKEIAFLRKNAKLFLVIIDPQPFIDYYGLSRTFPINCLEKIFIRKILTTQYRGRKYLNFIR